MRGYCPRCKEYRSDNGFDAWGIIWRNGRPICERCGSYVDVWRNNLKNLSERHVEIHSSVYSKGTKAEERVRKGKRKNKEINNKEN